MKKLISLTLFFLMTFTHSYGEVTGEGRFYAQDEDSLAFVKQQLIHLAFKDAITKEMDAMGLDSSLFWDRYEARFEESFKPILEGLQKKYDVGSEKQSWKQKNSYRTLEREKRLKARRKFGNLGQVISAYSIKKMSRSPQYPKSRFLQLSAKVDKRLLTRLYKSFLKDDQGAGLQKIYISTDFSIEGGNWSVLGIDLEDEFADPIQKYWRLWVIKQLNLDPDMVEVTDKSEETRLENSMRAADTLMAQTLGDEASGESEIAIGKKAIWLKFKVKIEWSEENTLLKKRQVKASVDMVAFNLTNNDPFFFQEIDSPAQTFYFSDPEKYSSSVASMVYRLPLPELAKFIRSSKSLAYDSRFKPVTIMGVSSISELFSLREFLQKKLVRFDGILDFKSYTLDDSKFFLQYRGVETDLKDAIMRLQGEALENGKKLIFPNKDNPFYIKLEGGPV